eukprot:scaffold6916_cov119-Isochrysis_galbana.AAC.5
MLRVPFQPPGRRRERLCGIVIRSMMGEIVLDCRLEKMSSITHVPQHTLPAVLPELRSCTVATGGMTQTARATPAASLRIGGGGGSAAGTSASAKPKPKRKQAGAGAPVVSGGKRAARAATARDGAGETSAGAGRSSRSRPNGKADKRGGGGGTKLPQEYDCSSSSDRDDSKGLSGSEESSSDGDAPLLSTKTRSAPPGRRLANVRADRAYGSQGLGASGRVAR